MLSFFRLSTNDQFIILNHNVMLVLNLNISRLLSLNCCEQMSCLFGSCNVVPFTPNKLEFGQLFTLSWALNVDTEQEYAALMKEISHLPKDKESFVLLTLFCLTKHSENFEAPEDVSNLHEGYASKLQQHWQQISCHEQLHLVLDVLSKMANILATKRNHQHVSI